MSLRRRPVLPSLRLSRVSSADSPLRGSAVCGAGYAGLFPFSERLLTEMTQALRRQLGRGRSGEHVRDHRLRRGPAVQGPADRRAWSGSSSAATTRPGSRCSRTTGSSTFARSGNLAKLKEAAGRERLARDDGRRPHALGDARRRQRGQRAPAHRLRGRRSSRSSSTGSSRTTASSRPSSRRAAMSSPPRPTPRWSRTCSSASTTATSSRRCAPCTSAGGPLHLRRHPPRRAGPARRRAAARRRSSSASARARTSSPRTSRRSSPRRAGSPIPDDGEIVEITPAGVRAFRPRTAARSSSR